MMKVSTLRLFLPGLLVAATGVGAGDLATGAFSGAAIGLGVLWAVLLGAFLKYVLSEGLARWQLVSGESLLEGALRRFGPILRGLIGLYIILWSFFVGAALMSAVGVTASAILPLGEELKTSKIAYGAIHSLVAIGLVYIGGYRLFEKVMGVCIALMFVIVLLTAIALAPPLDAVLAGLFIPSLPEGSIGWTIALMGGVGGTLTILCYAYWMREVGRERAHQLDACRMDLAVGYLFTALFGVAMVIIGHALGDTEGKGSQLIVNIANKLEETLGEQCSTARWIFLLGAWCAVFSSLLGVWQSVPYLFADYWRVCRREPGERVDTKGTAYRCFLWGIGILPIIGLIRVEEFREIQKLYAIIGALCIPAIALVLLFLNGGPRWISRGWCNRPWTNLILLLTVFFFAYAGWLKIERIFF